MHSKTPSVDMRHPLGEISSNGLGSNENSVDQVVAESRRCHLSTDVDAHMTPVTVSSDAASLHDDLFGASATASSSYTSIASSSSPTTSRAVGSLDSLPLMPTVSPRRASPRKRKASISGPVPAFRLPTPAPSHTSAKGKERDLSLYNARPQRRSPLDMLNRQQLGLRSDWRQVSLRECLRDYMSNNELQVFRSASQLPHVNFSVPFALAFSSAAKAGSTKKLLATSSNEGVVSFVDASHDNQWDAEHTRHAIQAHNNAIFDVTWSLDDKLVSTASGDQTAKLFDVETAQCVSVLAGHESTVKSVAWDPCNPQLLSTGSRDGSIALWDRRVPAEDLPPAQGPTGAFAPAGTCIGMVNYIANAHVPPKVRGSKARSGTRSVTSVAYMPQTQHHLVSSCSTDSMLKIWDLRKSQGKSARPRFEENNEEALLELGGQRPHGIANMKISPDGHRIYALSTDCRIHAFDAWNLSYPAPLASYSHPAFISSSFYLRLSLSPCSRYLASGSVDGSLFLWDTESPTERAVRLVGHTKEVSGVDWAQDVVATCSDDQLVRTWTVDRKMADRRRNRIANDEPELEWRYSGEVGEDDHLPRLKSQK